MNKAKKELLRKFKNKSFAKSEKIRNFTSENDEPSALACGFKPIPILSGDAAVRFLERAKQVEEEARKQRNKPLTLEQLEKQLMYEEFFLEDDRRALREREDRIENLKNKIKGDLSVHNHHQFM